MTKQAEVVGNPNYVPVLDHGFVGLVDSMGSDAAIVQAARVSYGDGTKSVREDRGLIRYLVRHKHTSPLEMCEIKIHIKMPIFVMRQWVRHRTASLNEYSGRYSVMTDEFYLPEPEVIQPQSKDNKQGRAGAVTDETATGVRWMMQAAYDHNYDVYQALLGERDPEKFQAGEVIYTPYDEGDALFDPEFDGIAREMARTVLPVGNYTELYWKQNLHNMMHLLKLRMDPHAQYEIRAYADAVYKLIQPLFPAALEAFDDYVREATTNSRMETELLKELLTSDSPARVSFAARLMSAGSDTAFAESVGLSLRELRDFQTRWNLPTFKQAPTVLSSIDNPETPGVPNAVKAKRKSASESTKKASPKKAVSKAPPKDGEA